MEHRWVVLTAVLTSVACSESGKPISAFLDQASGKDGRTILPDQSGEDAGDSLELVPHDRTEGDNGTFDSGSGCAPGEGCFLDPCEDGGGCLSGLCVDHLGDSVCTVTCVEECPEGWLCKLLAGGPDIVYACISPYTHLCRPCNDNEDCASANGTEDVCLDFGPGGSFCGADCSGEGICPAGYLCQPSLTVEGSAVTQCVPENGECACAEKSKKLGLTTGCWVENEWGTCTGTRACGPDGLSDCDAQLPAEELCDGLDNDCDGEADGDLCDDGNPCTADLCQGGDGCLNEPLTGDLCDDGNACTQEDHCDNGGCTGPLVDCDDGNLCTDDSCEPDAGCLYDENSLPCDDGDPCTFNDTCKDGTCAGAPLPCECAENEDCGPLEDGNFCNGTLFCDATKFPQSCEVDVATIVTCPKPEGMGAECLEPFCEPSTGECSLVPAKEGGACTDDNECTVGESCQEGLCAGGVPPNCNDSNPCTTDFCDPAEGCLHEDNQSPCDDGDVCSLNDVCLAGLCTAGTSQLECDDGNPCTDDACMPETGCTHGANTVPCDDNNSCTTGDICAAGQCQGTGLLECDDGNPCTKDLCLAQGGCAHEPAPAACSDGDPCTVNDQCQDGACLSGPAMDCNDGNVCTDDSCLAGLCSHAANDAGCDDGNPCTTGDHCTGGLCAPADALDCDDANVCTTDWCSPALGCVHNHNALPCDDGNACTAGDVCENGQCQGGSAVNCNDGNLCTNDSCEPGTGCLHVDNTTPCNDGDACTTGDVCADGACAGPGKLNCDDGNLCTDDSCDPVAGCGHTFNTAPCNDGNPCTTDDECLQAACLGGPDLDCNDNNICTDDGCDPDAGCTHQVNTLACDDGDACTTGDLCALGACAGTAELNCNDGNLCTDDACEPAIGCVYDDNALPCNDSDVCTTGDTCQAGDCTGTGLLDCDDSNVCTDDSCDPLVGCLHPPNQEPCDDGSACTLEDQCAAGVCTGGPAPECDDGNACTVDGCDPLSGCTNPPAPAETRIGLCRACDGDGGEQLPADDADCGTIDCDELNFYFTDGEASATGTNWCKLRDYADLTDERCLSLEQCKEPGGDGCTTFADSTVATCGVCRFASGACQECQTYADDTGCGQGHWCQGGACVAQAMVSCKAWKSAGHNNSGTYSISPGGAGPYTVYCDMSTQGGGWTKVNSLGAGVINSIMGASARELMKCSDAGTTYFMSPTFTNKSWSWSTKQAVGGTWVVNGANQSCGTASEFNAASYGWGFGCSNGGGGHNKWYPGMCDNCGFPCNCGIPKGHTNSSFSVCGSNNYGTYSIFVREN